MHSAPLLDTARLRLRPHRPQDFADCSAMWTDPAVTRFIGGRASTPQQTWSRMLSYIGHWTAMGYGYWALEERSTGRFVGEAGFADFKRDAAPALHGVPELGFALISAVHGRGYGTEAAGAVIEWGDAHLRSERTVCLVNEENAASLRIVRRFGYRVFDRAEIAQSAVAFCERIRRSEAPRNELGAGE